MIIKFKNSSERRVLKFCILRYNNIEIIIIYKNIIYIYKEKRILI